VSLGHKKNGFALLMVLFAWLCAAPAMAEFPEKNITVVVPKSPGGGTDISTRGLVQFAKKHTDVDILVQNKPGAAGVIGMVAGARAKPDGYNLVMTVVELDILPHLKRSPVDHTAFDFLVAPIAEPAGLIVRKDSPFDSVDDFVAYAQANPGKLKVGNAGVGSIWHLAAVAMKKQYGINFRDVPYAGGSAEAVAALVGGHLDALTVGPGNAKAQLDAGEFRLLGLMSESRLAMFPDVPTFSELGHDTTVRAWAALAVPKGVPEDRLAKLRQIFGKAVRDPAFIEMMARQGIEVNTADSESVTKMVTQDSDYYKSLIQDIGLE
jgi:tripartite-type tricarboxylate transporter receptor subunit TctC